MTTTIEDLPIRARPEGLHKLCDHLKSGGTDRGTIISDMPYDEDFVDEHINYGQVLGFLSEDDRTINLQDRGVRLAYENGVSSLTEELFLRGLKEDNIYLEFLECIRGGDRADENSIRLSDVMRNVKTSFGDIPFEEYELESGVRTFFMTLEAAGLGTYRLRRGSSESRLDLREGIKLGDVIDESIKNLKRPTPTPQSQGTFLDGFDNQLQARVEPQFRRGFYHDAVGTAFTVLEDRIRDVGGFDPDDHGKVLMTNAFDEDSGPLSMGDVRSEKEGFKLLYTGAYQALRNPPSHRILDDMDSQQAKDALSMVNFLLTLVENKRSP